MESRVFSNEDIEKLNDSVIITHVHTHGSDGNLSERDAIVWAFENNVAIFGNSEHDRADYKFYKEMGWDPEELKYVFHKIKGEDVSDQYIGEVVWYVQSLELTTFDYKIRNEEDKPTKCHLLLLAPDLSTKNELVELIALKGQNDDDYDMGMVTCLYQYKGIPFPKDKFNEFRRKERAKGNRASRVSKKTAIKYFKEHPEEIKKLGASSLMVIRRLLSKFERQIVRINIPIEIGIAVAHKYGALVFVPHLDKTLFPLPKEQWRPFIRHLLDLGVDGICLKEIKSEEVQEIAFDELQKFGKPLINDGGGPDCHTTEDYMNANLVKWKLVDSRDAVYSLNELQKAREAGKMSYLDYEGIDINAVDAFLKISKEYVTKCKLDLTETFEKAEWERVLALWRDKTTKDCYNAEFLIDEYLQGNKNVSVDVLDYAKTLQSISVGDFYDMMHGRFKVPEPEPSEKGEVRKMVSKPAPRFSNNGKTR